MKEEWKSAIYFCRGEKDRIKKMNSLISLRDRKQRALERKILEEWRKAWMIPHQEWERQCRELKQEYEAGRARLLARWREANSRIKKANKQFGCNIPLIPQPEIPPLKLLQSRANFPSQGYRNMG